MAHCGSGRLEPHTHPAKSSTPDPLHVYCNGQTCCRLECACDSNLSACLPACLPLCARRDLQLASPLVSSPRSPLAGYKLSCQPRQSAPHQPPTIITQRQPNPPAANQHSLARSLYSRQQAGRQLRPLGLRQRNLSSTVQVPATAGMVRRCSSSSSSRVPSPLAALALLLLICLSHGAAAAARPLPVPAPLLAHQGTARRASFNRSLRPHAYLYIYIYS